MSLRKNPELILTPLFFMGTLLLTSSKRELRIKQAMELLPLSKFAHSLPWTLGGRILRRAGRVSYLHSPVIGRPPLIMILARTLVALLILYLSRMGGVLSPILAWRTMLLITIVGKQDRNPIAMVRQYGKVILVKNRRMNRMERTLITSLD